MCRLYKKVDKNSKGSGRPRDGEVPDQEPENEVPLQVQVPQQMPILEEQKMLHQEGFSMLEDLVSFGEIFSPYYEANPMGLYHIDNSLFFQSCQSSLIGGSQTLRFQIGQNPLIHQMIPGNRLLPAEPYSCTDNIKYEHFNDYHSDELLNNSPVHQGNNATEPMVSGYKGAPNSVSDDQGASKYVVSPSFNDDRQLKKPKMHL